MLKALSKYEAEAYALLRILSGFMFSLHGAQKALGILTDRPMPPFLSQGWWGGWIELLGGLLIMLGVKTREAAFLSSGTMAVAYIQFHWKLALGRDFLPGINGGEMAALYCFVFLLIATKGSGIWALKKD